MSNLRKVNQILLTGLAVKVVYLPLSLILIPSAAKVGLQQKFRFRLKSRYSYLYLYLYLIRQHCVALVVRLVCVWINIWSHNRVIPPFCHNTLIYPDEYEDMKGNDDLMEPLI